MAKSLKMKKNTQDKKTIILDTNFLLEPAKFGVDIFEEINKIALFDYELAIVEGTIEELDKIAIKQGGKTKKEVKLAKDIIKSRLTELNRSNVSLKQKLTKQKNFRTFAQKAKALKTIKTANTKEHNYLDDKIIEIAAKNPDKYMVATQDRQLKKRLKQKGVKVITIRQKKYAIIEE